MSTSGDGVVPEDGVGSQVDAGVDVDATTEASNGNSSSSIAGTKQHTRYEGTKRTALARSVAGSYPGDDRRSGES